MLTNNHTRKKFTLFWKLFSFQMPGLSDFISLQDTINFKSKNMNLTRPTLLIDPQKSKNNISRMHQKAKTHRLTFRPHFKTHQSRNIGSWFKDLGVDKITVSSVEMARYFADDGWKDITIAFPHNIPETQAVNELAGRIRLNLTVLNPEGVEALDRGLNHPVGLYIKIDTGARRTGIPFDQVEEIRQLKKQIEQSANLRFEGLLTHAGHTYRASSREKIIEIHKQTRDRLVNLKQQIREKGETIRISVGDTPSACLANEFENIDEIRPGNFVFYDMQQYKLNVCSMDDIAVALACPVVAKHKERGQIVVYGGAVHLSKDTFPEAGTPVYGYGVIINEKGWIMPEEKIIVSGLSQEHGILSVSPSMLKRLSIGDFVGILPAHSCLTANLMGGYLDPQGHAYDHLKMKPQKNTEEI
jgi:D-serine deaminase-like pyridoxal phosphate-dependent protein